MELEEILKRLILRRVEFVLVGGFAGVVHGAPIVTRDIDVCLKFTHDNLDRLASAFQDMHPVHRLAAQPIPFEITDTNWNRFRNIYLQTDLGILDCLGEVLGIGDFDQVISESESIDLPFGSITVLKIESLIRAKEAMGRPHDLQTSAHLRLILEKRRH